MTAAFLQSSVRSSSVSEIDHDSSVSESSVFNGSVSESSELDSNARVVCDSRDRESNVGGSSVGEASVRGSSNWEVTETCASAVIDRNCGVGDTSDSDSSDCESVYATPALMNLWYVTTA